MEQQQGRKRRISAAARRFQGLVRPHPPQYPIKCPRCDSMNTKFCYYNNYSLSQPRHFCKACHRYWTQGGTHRNIPVGGSHSKKSCSKSTIVAESPIGVASSSTISVETSLHSNVHHVPAVATSRSSTMPPQPARGCMLPSYSSADDGLLSSVIASIPSLNYPQDTFSGQPVINNQLSDVVNSLGTNLGFLQDFDVSNLMVSSLNDYGQQLQPVQSFHQDLYTLTGVNSSEATHLNGGMSSSSGGIIGGSSAYPNNDLSFANIPGYGYSSNNYW